MQHEALPAAARPAFRECVSPCAGAAPTTSRAATAATPATPTSLVRYCVHLDTAPALFWKSQCLTGTAGLGGWLTYGTHKIRHLSPLSRCDTAQAAVTAEAAAAAAMETEEAVTEAAQAIKIPATEAAVAAVMVWTFPNPVDSTLWHASALNHSKC